MKKLAFVLIALALIGVTAGCGKSSKSAAPHTSSSSGPQSQSEAKQVAQQSATFAASYVEQVKSLLVVAARPEAKPARLHPFGSLGAATDSSSWTYSFQGYDINGAPIDWVTQSGQLASLAIDYQWFYHLSGDSLVETDDVRSHTKVSGLDSLSTRYVATAKDTTQWTYDGYSGGSHLTYLYDGKSTITSLAWEKSGTPTYPVAGTIVVAWHWVYTYAYGAQNGAGDIVTNATVTFNGTRYATVTVGSYTFTYDLQLGTVS